MLLSFRSKINFCKEIQVPLLFAYLHSCFAHIVDRHKLTIGNLELKKIITEL